MKSWFVFEVNGEKIGVWANNLTDAEVIVSRRYPVAKFLGIDYGSKFGVKADRCLYDGVVPIEMLIMSGVMDCVLGGVR